VCCGLIFEAGSLETENDSGSGKIRIPEIVYVLSASRDENGRFCSPEKF
jgi:hypothetical protein